MRFRLTTFGGGAVASRTSPPTLGSSPALCTLSNTGEAVMRLVLIVATLGAALLLAGCGQGPAGPKGESGPTGPAGPPGPAGAAGPQRRQGRDRRNRRPGR